MTQRYNSYLIRCWSLDGGQHRIRIEHIQSGVSTQVPTLLAALAWLDTHAQHADTQPPDGQASPDAGADGLPGTSQAT
jgi:hypothetical protein